MKRKHERQPPAQMKAESDLTAQDKEELRKLKIGEGPFNTIITDNVAFALSTGWTTKRRDDKHHILWEVKPSPHSNKQALRFTANVPRCNAATLAHLLIDDKYFDDDPDVSNIYKYQTLITENHIDKRIGGNVTVQRSNFRAPVILVSPRQMVSYVTLGCLLSPSQQQALNVWPTALKPAKVDSVTTTTTTTTTGAAAAPARTDSCMAFLQCSVDYTGNESPLVKGHVLGHTYRYIVMGVEEPDGSLSLTFAMDMDPAGKLPAKVVDAANDEQLKTMQLMIEWLKEKGPADHICDVYQNTREFPVRNDV